MTANNETFLKDDTLITSKTDLKGSITYANDDFCTFSGFSESEVIGKPHNIVRHTDMPKAAFKLLWQALKIKKEFFAFVFNVDKNGRKYWVFANVTPSYDLHGEVIGYYSVRRRASKAGVETMQNLYAQLCEIEKTQGVNAALEKIEQILKDAGKSWDEMMIELQNEGKIGGYR